MSQGFSKDRAERVGVGTFWITTLVHLVVIVALTMVIVSVAVAFEHLPLPWVESWTARPGASRWWVAAAVVGIVCVGAGFLVLAATGMGGFPFSRVTSYLGLPLTPGLGFVLVGAGVLAVRAAARRVDAVADDVVQT